MAGNTTKRRRRKPARQVPLPDVAKAKKSRAPVMRFPHLLDASIAVLGLCGLVIAIIGR